MISPKLVIFDMDGTMLDTEKLSFNGWLAASKQMGFEVTEEEFWPVYLTIVGTNATTFKARLAEFFGEDYDMDTCHGLCLADMDRHFAQHGVPIKPGLIELLDKLDEKGIKKCVATSTEKTRATHKLKLAGIAHRFEVIVGGLCVPNSKPAPDIFLHAAELCGVSPEDCLVIEDSVAGTTGGYNAGMKVINVPDILPASDEVKRMAWRVCDGLRDVVEIL